MKRCGTCKESLPDSAFTRDRRRNGLRSKCKACANVASRAYNAAHREVVNARSLAYAAAHREEAAANSRAWNAANAERQAANHRAWVEAHPLEMAARSRNYSARKRGATVMGAVPATIKDDLIVFFGPTCMVPECEETKLEIDHVVSLKHHGPHSVDNFQLLCRSHNASKGMGDTDYRFGRQLILSEGK